MFEHEGSAPGVFLSPRGRHGLIVSPTSLDRSDRASMTLRASMLVPLIYDAPNLRRVTYIVSPRVRVSLFTRAVWLLRTPSDLDPRGPNGVTGYRRLPAGNGTRGGRSIQYTCYISTQGNTH